MNDHEEQSKRKENQGASLDRMSVLFGRRANSIDPTPRPGFKNALLTRLCEARRVPSMPRFSLKMLPVALPVLIVLIIAVLVFQPFFGVRTVFAYDQFVLTPESSDAAGVEADSDYILESRNPVDVSDVEHILTVKTQHDVDYDLEQVSKKKLRIAFAESLAPEEIVKFTLATEIATPDGATTPRKYDWAFQVKGDFQVTYSIPGDKTSEVPLDVGFEFGFNYENIDPDEFEKALSIEPAVSGRVEHSRRTFVFVPDDVLKSDTMYSVTLKGSLSLEGSDETLGEDYSYVFQTASETERGYSFGVGDVYQTVTPDTTVRFPFWSSDDQDHGSVRVRLYTYTSFDAYLEALKKAEEIRWQYGVTAEDLYETQGATPAIEFDVDIVQYDYDRFLVFPANVPLGYYIVDIEQSEARAWAFLTSSNITAYVSRATNKTLVWVNDAATDQPLSGATVAYVDDDPSSTTDEQGLASIVAEEDQGGVVLIKKGDDAVAVLLRGEISYEGGWEVGGNVDTLDDFWSYVYTDRPTYRPTDVVSFWGYAEGREDGVRPTRVCARLDIVEEVCVDATENGTFEGEMNLSRVPAGYYDLNIFSIGSAEERHVAGRGISVSEYVKPAYTLSLTTDVDAVFVGDPIGFTVHGQYFEGTPVNGLQVEVNGECGSEVLTLDDLGNARGSFTCSYEDGAYYPRSTWLEVRPARPEEGDIYASASVMLFGPKVYLDVDWEKSFIKNNTGYVEATVRNVQAVNTWDPEIFGPTTRSGQTVRGKVLEITYTQKEIGEYYDFIRKQVVKRYRYDRHEKTISEFSVVSGDDGLVAYEFPATTKDANYRVELETTDELGRTDRKELYLWQRQDLEYGGEGNALTFWNDDAGAQQWEFPGYSVSDTAHLSVYQMNKPYTTPEGGRFLYYQAHRGIQETRVTDEARYVFPFTQENVPNTSVYGVLYHDDLYQIIGGGGYQVSYDTSDSELKLTVNSAKEDYRPGEDVAVSVHTEDKDGPVSAEVSVNVVDEAYYALFPEEVNTLASLYAWVADGVLVTDVTREAASYSFGAEKGGGGERGLGRFTFKDTADFLVIQTDENGNGSARFTLPDNITSWRVTAQGIEPDAKRAGDTKINVDASLPFFIDVVMRDSYLDDDEPVVLARAAGTQVGLGDSVEWTVQAPDASFEKKTVQVAREALEIELPDLELGSHHVTISASVGSLSDKVTRTVIILPSRLVKPVISTTLFDGDGAVEGATDRYSEVTFVDGGSGRYYGELVQLASTWGDRADEALVRLLATRMLNENFGETREEPEFQSSLYWDVAIRLLPYASFDPELTAKIALLGGETPFGSVAGYFDGRLNDTGRSPLTPRETAQAFAALGAEGWPVLGELQRAAKTFEDDSDAQLWTALGLEAMGDGESARKIYRELLKNTKEQSGYVYFEGDEIETTIERTAMMAILAAALNESDRDKLYEYVTNHYQGKTLVVLEQLLFVKKAMATLSDESAEVAYTLRGKRQTAELSKGSTVTVLISPEELALLDARATKGVVMAVSRYLTPAIDPNAPIDPSLRVVRTYASDQGASTTFEAGDLIKMSLRFTVPESNCSFPWETYEEAVSDEAVSDESAEPRSSAPCETYEITDIVPSGLTVVTPHGFGTYEDKGSCYDWPVSVEDQRVTFFVTPRTETACRNGALTYYARVVTPGSYLAEPAYIRSTRDPEQNNRSAAATLTILP